MPDPLADLPRLSDDAMGPCIVCKRQLLETEVPLFYRLDVKQCGIDAAEVNRHVGLAMSMGGGRDGLVLAGVMGPGVKPVVVMNSADGVNVCHNCAVTAGVMIVAGLAIEGDDDAQGDR